MTIENKIDYKKEILDIVDKENNRPIPVGIIIKKLEKKHGFKQISKNQFFNSLDALIKTGQLVQLKSGKIVMGYQQAEVDMTNIFKGTIAINSKKTGFITLENENESKYFVHKTNLSNALDGDEVEFALLKTKPDPTRTLLDAKVLKVLNHAKDSYVGLFVSDSNGYHIETDNQKMYLPVKLEDTQGLVNGSKILYKIIKYENDHALAQVKKIIGHKSDVGTDILSIVLDNGVEPEFEYQALEQAKKISLDIDDYQKSIRKDLTNLNIITIDPATSKDFDDAIYCEQIDKDNFRLFVSIADVSHYVKWNSVLDKEAIRRGCSIYLVDRVIPMLPHNLSDDICSLVPGQKRLALTCEMVINSKGDFKDIKVYPSIIKSQKRFSYDEVNEFFDGKNSLTDSSKELKDMLLVSKKLHEYLSSYKNKRGYIEFEIPEPKIIVNEKGIPIDIELRETGQAQKLIEDFMVAANEAVTIYAIKQKWPFVYRVHDKPNELKLEMFVKEAQKLRFKVPNKVEDIQPNTISKWLENNQDNTNKDLIHILLLRTMAKAEYDTKNIGHFGLASDNYTHFTSPIRRYPDLLVHRIYWMYLFEKDKYSDDQRQQLVDSLKTICDLSNKSEIVAVDTERDVNAMKFAEYMQKHIGEVFEATVTTISSFGMFIQLPNTIEGLIRIANLKDDYYTYDEKQRILLGKNKKRVLTLGSKVKAKVISASKIERKIEFELVEFLGNR